MPDKNPFVPPERDLTAPQLVHEVLRHLNPTLGPLSAKDISAQAGLSERAVLDALEHLRKTLGHGRERVRLGIEPSTCLACGFVFAKRDRLSKPGKCPVCQSTHIAEPRFFLRG